MSEKHIPDSVKRFADKCRTDNTSDGLHIIYHIQSFDSKGNVTNEAFAKNIMTNYGFRTAANNGYIWFDSYDSHYLSYLWLGTGTTEPTKEDLVMESISPIISTACVQSSSYESGAAVPIERYDSENDLIYTDPVSRVKYTYNYNLSGVTTDCSFCEIGISHSTTTPSVSNIDTCLYHHALIYDENNQLTYFIKKPNEKMIITVYFIYSMKAQLIRDMNANGDYFAGSIFAFLDIGYSVAPFYRVNTNCGFNTKLVQDWLTLKNSNMLKTNIDQVTPSMISDTRFPSNTQLYENKYTSMPSYESFGNNANNNRGYLILHPNCFHLDSPETITEDTIHVDYQSHDKALLTIGNSFGDSKNASRSSVYCGWGNGVDMPGGSDYWGDPSSTYNECFPITNFNMLSSYRYNHLTKNWDIEETIHNAPDRIYENSFGTGAYAMITMEYQGVSNVFTIYINAYTNLPIYRFTTGATISYTIYASDEYWDTSTWIPITNIDSIPVEAQMKRYYIIPNAAPSLKPRYQNSDIHAIVPQEPFYKTDMTDTFTTGNQSYKMLCSDTNGWVMFEKELYFPELKDGNDEIIHHKIVDLATYDSSKEGTFAMAPEYRWCTDDRIIGVNCNYYYHYNVGGYMLYRVFNEIIRVYNISNDGSNPTYTELRLDLGLDDTSDRGWLIYSFNNQRFLTMWSINLSKGFYVDIYGENDTAVYYEIDSSCRELVTVLNTNYIVYFKNAENVLNNNDCHTQVNSNTSFVVYDALNKTIYDEQPLPDAYNNAYIYSIIAVGNNVYFTINSNGNKTLHYNISSKVFTIVPDFFNDGFKHITNSVLYNDHYDRSVALDEEFIWLSGNNNGNAPSPNVLIKMDDPLYPTTKLFGTSYQYQNRTYIPQVFEAYNGKHKIMLGLGSFTQVSYNSNHDIGILDIGYCLDHDLPYTYKWRSCNQSTRNSAVGKAACVYKNNLIMHETSGYVFSYPIEAFLAHKVTGTTTSMNALNNPIQIYYDSVLRVNASCDPTLWNYTQKDMTYNDFHCVQDIAPMLTDSLAYKMDSNSISIITDGPAMLIGVATIKTTVDTLETITESGWTLLASNKTTAGGTKQRLAIYTKTVSAAGTYSFTVNRATGDNGAGIVLKLCAVKNVTNITASENKLITANNFTTAEGSGKRIFIINCAKFSSLSGHTWMNNPIIYNSEYSVLPVQCMHPYLYLAYSDVNRPTWAFTYFDPNYYTANSSAYISLSLT